MAKLKSDFVFLTLKHNIMGRCQRGVHFGVVGLKEVEERSKFPIANFCFTFSYTIFKQLCNIMATQNKYCF
jgi:hypothetical protein